MLCLLTVFRYLYNHPDLHPDIYIFNEITGQINISLAVEWITFYKQCYLGCDQTIKGKFMIGCCSISAGMLKCKLCAHICASGSGLNYGLPRQMNVRYPDWTFEGSTSWRWQTIWLHDNKQCQGHGSKEELAIHSEKPSAEEDKQRNMCRTETHTGWPILS